MVLPSLLIASAIAGDIHPLLIGISSYADQPRLGADRDLDVLQAALQHRGIPASQITVLRNHEATPERVLAAISTLAEITQPGDHILIHFSGHGQQLPDDSGDEASGWDEALLLSGGVPLRDDVLGEAIATLRASVGSGGSVAVTLDACSSGTATRGGPLLQQGLLIPEVQPQSSDSPLVVLSAAAPGGAAHEVYGEDGEPLGAFSAALAYELAQHREGQRWGSLYARIRATVHSTAPGQRPLLEGPADLPLFGGVLPSTEPSVMVAGQLSDGRLRLAGGLLHGLTPGSRIEIHLPEAARPTPESLLAVGEVVSAQAATAMVRLDTDSDHTMLQAGQAFVTRVALAPSMLSVQLDIASPTLHTAWSTALQQAPLLVEAEHADYTLRQESVAAEMMLRATATDALILQEAAAPPGHPGAAMLSRLLHISQASALRNIQLSGQRYAVDVRLLEAAAGSCEVLGFAEEHSFAPSDTLRLRVEHTGDAPVYLTVLHIDTADQVTQLHPPPGDQPPLLLPEASWDVPACWSPAPPYGAEQLMVLATRQPLSLSTLTLQKLRGTVVTDGYAADLFFVTTEQ